MSSSSGRFYEMPTNNPTCDSNYVTNKGPRSSSSSHYANGSHGEQGIYDVQSGYRFQGGYEAKRSRKSQHVVSAQSNQIARDNQNGNDIQSSQSMRSHDSNQSHFETDFESSSKIKLSKFISEASSYTYENQKVPAASINTQTTTSISVGNVNEENIDLSESASLHSSDLNYSDFKQTITFDPARFFELLQQIPSISEISSSSQLSHSQIEIQERLFDRDNKGYFVEDPTANVSTPFATEESVESVESNAIEKSIDDWRQVPEAIYLEELQLKLPEVPSEFKIDNENLDAKPQTEEEIISQLYADIFKPIEMQEKDSKLREEQEKREMIMDIVNCSINDLINKVVDKCVRNATDPKRILRSSLDKVALTDELIRRLAELEEENYRHEFLNRKAVEYFRRKKVFSAIEERDRNKVSKGDETKYADIIKHLNRLLCRQNEIRTVTQNKISELNRRKVDLQSHLKQISTEFDTMIWELFGRRMSDNARMFVEKKLSRMKELRAEISVARTALIDKQHIMARLSKRLEDLENLGNGLYLRDFENVQRQTIMLSKELEERTNEFDKYSSRCSHQIHVSTHLREKVLLMRDHVAAQEKELAELIEEKQSLREEIRIFKIKRLKLQKEIRDLSFQCGLLDKPALLLDYDATFDQLTATRANIVQIKSKLSELNTKIKAAEEKLSKIQ